MGRADDKESIIDFVPVTGFKVSAYKIPTDTPEADGTLEWTSTTLVLVQLQAGNETALGYTYAHETVAFFIEKKLKRLVINKNALDIEAITGNLIRQIRNSGTCGITMMAIAAIDTALWDLKAKILKLPLCKLLGQVHTSMPIYGSGGFTSYNKQQLQRQFLNWAEKGILHFKMKVGAQPESDKLRIKEAREVLNDAMQLMIDANGAYTVRQALQIAYTAAVHHVTWFEEPVSSDKLQQLRFIREKAPHQINIAAGEYGYNLSYFKTMLSAKAVDVLQADATRCGGISGFLKAGYLAEAYGVPFSAHCAPALHIHPAVCLPSFYLAEYFHDHVRIETLLFDGIPPPVDGSLKPDLSRAGLGLTFKEADAVTYKI